MVFNSEGYAFGITIFGHNDLSTGSQSIEEGIESTDVIKEEKDEDGEFFGAFFFKASEESRCGVYHRFGSACTAATEEDEPGFSIGFELIDECVGRLSPIGGNGMSGQFAIALHFPLGSGGFDALLAFVFCIDGDGGDHGFDLKEGEEGSDAVEGIVSIEENAVSSADARGLKLFARGFYGTGEVSVGIGLCFESEEAFLGKTCDAVVKPVGHGFRWGFL